MAAATVVNPPATGRAGPQEHGAMIPMKGATLYRWSLVADNADTHATGLKGILETAITGTRAASYVGALNPTFASGNIAISSVSTAGVVTFSAAGSTLFDLLVWASN